LQGVFRAGDEPVEEGDYWGEGVEDEEAGHDEEGSHEDVDEADLLFDGFGFEDAGAAGAAALAEAAGEGAGGSYTHLGES